MTINPEYRSIYSSITEIRSELERRKNDIGLQKEVQQFLAADAPSFLRTNNKQYAYFSRPIITPNLEARYFLDILSIFNLEPLFLEFPDMFVSKSREKRFAAKLCFFKRRIGHPGVYVQGKTLIDFHRWEGEPFLEVKTMSGENLLELHHKIFREKFPHLSDRIIDITDWFSRARVGYKYYYQGYLSLFLCNGVLFENFEFNNPEEHRFFEEKVWEGYLELKRLFGVKPLIHPMVPLKDEMEPLWLSYSLDDSALVEILRKHEMIEL